MSLESLSLVEKLHENVVVDGKMSDNYKIIATNIIPQGSVIYTGKPFLVYKGDSKLSPSDNLHKLWNFIDKDFKNILGSENLIHLKDLYPRTINDVLNNKYLMSTTNKDIISKIKELDEDNFSKYMFLAKIDINQFGEGANNKLYKSISFFNHSCVPNCFVLSDPTYGDELYVVNARPIYAGEELTINYGPKYICDDTGHRRYHILSDKHFVCNCVACYFQKEFPTINDNTNQLNMFRETKLYKHCYYCGQSPDKLQECTQCRLVMYCNKDCQKLHWKLNHKKHCKILIKNVA